MIALTFWSPKCSSPISRDQWAHYAGCRRRHRHHSDCKVASSWDHRSCWSGRILGGVLHRRKWVNPRSSCRFMQTVWLWQEFSSKKNIPRTSRGPTMYEGKRVTNCYKLPHWKEGGVNCLLQAIIIETGENQHTFVQRFLEDIFNSILCRALTSHPVYILTSKQQVNLCLKWSDYFKRYGNYWISSPNYNVHHLTGTSILWQLGLNSHNETAATNNILQVNQC